VTDVSKLETDFKRLLAWIQQGDVTHRHDGFPYKWERAGFEAQHMRQSPAGEFYVIQHPQLYVYLRPGKYGYGYMKLIDFRLGTVDMLSRLANSATERKDTDVRQGPRFDAQMDQRNIQEKIKDIDVLKAENERFRTALQSIASCRSVHDGDIVSIAQKALLKP